MLFYCPYCEETVCYGKKAGMAANLLVCPRYDGDAAVSEHSIQLMREDNVYRIVYSSAKESACATPQCELYLWYDGLFCDNCGIMHQKGAAETFGMLRACFTLDNLLVGMEQCFEYAPKFSTAIWEDNFGEVLKELFRRNKSRNSAILSCAADSVLPVVILEIIVEYTCVQRAPPLHWRWSD